MKIAKAFVTGGTGFIGARLVKRLTERGVDVTCLVRQQSNMQRLENLPCQLVYGDLRDPALTLAGIAQCDVLFHVAAMKNAGRVKKILKVNRDSTQHLFDAILRSSASPRVIQVSTLAASGSSSKDRPRIESDQSKPVSFYGRSKLESDRVAVLYADRMPVSIVRPPIVLGQGDSNGLKMFKLLQKFNCHLVPGLITRHYSVIHVDDLVEALICVASQGQPIPASSDDPIGEGVYFAASQQLSYADLGRQIGQALGRTQTKCLHIARPFFWSISAVNTLWGRITDQPQLLNLDKYREAVAGDWTCSSAKLFNETDFSLPVPFATRLQQTVQWYQSQGWLDHVQEHYTGNVSRTS